MSVERSAVVVLVAIGLAFLLLVYAIGTARVTSKQEPTGNAMDAIVSAPGDCAGCK